MNFLVKKIANEMTCLEAPSSFAKSCKIEERTTQTNVILFDTFRLPFTREHDSKIQKASNCVNESVILA